MESKKAVIEEMENKLKEQFDLLHDTSKECEPEYLESLIDSMLKIYATLNQGYQFFQE
ncbi:hypothetical protein ACV3RS_11495 [Clostridium perfringens]